MDWDGETVVTLQEVAEKLKVTVKTVRNWTEGKSEGGRVLESRSFGGVIRTTKEAVNRFSTSRTPLVIQSAASYASELQRNSAHAKEELRRRFGIH